jgi:hypothetical protein
MEEADYSYLTNPYEVPVAYLPVDASVPDATGEILPVEVKPLLAGIASSTKSLMTNLRTQLLGTNELRTGLLKLSHQFVTARQFLLELPEVKRMAQDFDYQTSRAAIERGYGQLSAEQHLGYTIYDRYFEVVRVENLSFLQFIAQIIFTGETIVDDLSGALLERDEITALVEALYYAVLTLVNSLERAVLVPTVWSGDTTNSGEPNEPPLLDSALPFTTNNVVNPDFTEQKALYRWKIGHHLFNLCAIFGRNALAQACRTLAAELQPDWESAVAGMQSGRIFWRGTTAAMWYAGNFPAAIYQNIVRPSMVSTRMPDGFSGDQNLDYARLKEAKDDFKTVLQADPMLLANANAAFRQALSEFNEVYVLDNEAHTLLAAGRVGNDTSLVHKEWQAGLVLSRRITAVDVLRQMSELRRQEFDFIFSERER